MKILVSHSARSTFVGTTSEYLCGFGRSQGFETDYIHVTHDAIPRVEWSNYEAAIVSYCARLSIPGYVSRHFLDELSNFNGVKELIAQDEYENTNELLQQTERIGLDLIFTCTPLVANPPLPACKVSRHRTAYDPDRIRPRRS
jgi:hypothetical protein